MRDETLLLGIPKILTSRRLARAIGTPLLLASIAAGATATAFLTGNPGAAVAALAWSAGALIVMRPDEDRLAAALRDATATLRSFLARRDDVRASRLSSEFLSTVNPLDGEHGWPALVLLGGLPRGGWSLLAVPPLLAAGSLFVAGCFLVASLPTLLAILLLLIFAAAATLLGLDAYASMLRGTLVPLAPEAGKGLLTTLTILTAIDIHLPAIAAERDDSIDASDSAR
jgi:protein-S-isoprenylcysteine O-methyltransferase Ste14